MNTEMMKQFDVLDMESLEMIEGGACSWNGIAGATAQGAIGGAVTGAFAGNMTLPIAGSVPGYIGGGVLGGLGGAAAYGGTCWWVR